ncbi:hypothetical protein [Nocardia puris]
MAIGAVAVGYLLLTAPDVVGFVVMLLGAVALWRMRPRRMGVRR